MVNNNSIFSTTTTTQSFDRLVGTAAVIGLSLVVVLHSWISSPSEEEDDVIVEEETEEGSNQQQHQQPLHNAAAASPSRRKVNDNKSTTATKSSSWWWPVAILTRRKKKRRKRRMNTHHHDGNNDNIENRHGSPKTNEDSSSCDDGNDGYCDHLGSCDCGSIQFILKGPKHLQPIQSPGRIHYPHIQTSATNFQLLKGEADMRFQYVQEETNNDEEEDYDNNNNNNNTTSGNNNTNGDDTSTIATEHIEKHHVSSLGAHVFCGNCGVHVMHADRSSEELEVNANCLLERKKELQQTSSSAEEEQTKEQQRQQEQIQKQTSSMSSLSTIDGDTTTTITTDPVTLTRSLSQQQHQLNSVSEHELFLGGSAQFWNELDTNQTNISGDNHNSNKSQELEHSQHARTESISSTGEQTHPSSYTTALDTPTYDGDDYSIDGSLLAPSGGGGGGGASVSASLSVNAGLLPPLPPSRLPPLSSTSDSKSVRTLPPWFGERPGYASHPARSVGGGWSVASMETNDLDSVGGESTTTVSPRMRDQMKFYMSRHMKKDKKKSGRSESV